MFNFFRKKTVQYLSAEEQKDIVHAIQLAEQETSGELRLYIEGTSKTKKALERAVEVFEKLNMHKTAEKNGVLIYVAFDDRQLAIFADDGIYSKAGAQFWEENVQQMTAHFKEHNFAQGLKQVITQIGATLQHAFPFQKDSDKNELPDDIVFGK